MANPVGGYFDSSVTEEVRVNFSTHHSLVYLPASARVEVWVDEEKVFARGLSGCLRYRYFPRTVEGQTRNWLFVGSDYADNTLIGLEEGIIAESTAGEIEKGGIWTWVYPNPTGTALAVVEQSERLVFYDFGSLEGPRIPADKIDRKFERVLSPWTRMIVLDPEDRFPLEISEQHQIPGRWGPEPASGSGWINDTQFIFMDVTAYRVVLEVQSDGNIIPVASTDLSSVVSDFLE